jgi:superkiller protein 3
MIGGLVVLLVLLSGYYVWLISRRNASWYYQEALVHYRNGDLTKAKSYLVDAIKRRPSYSNVLYTLGLIAHAEDNLKDAAGWYSKTLEVNPNDTDALYNKGQVHLDQNDVEQALETFVRLSELADDGDVESQMALGFCHDLLGNIDEAKSLYELVITIDPEQVEAYFKLGRIADGDGEYEKAIGYYDKVVSLNDKHESVYTELAQTYAKMDEWEPCKVACEQALALDPTNAKVYNQLGLIYYGQQDYNEAVRHYQKAVELDPTFAIVYNNLGYALEKLDMYKEAFRSFFKYTKFIDDPKEKAIIRMKMAEFQEKLNQDYAKEYFKPAEPIQ